MENRLTRISELKASEGVDRNPDGASTSPATKFKPCGTVTAPLKLPTALRVPPAIISSRDICTPIGANLPANPLNAYRAGPFENT